LKALPFVYGKRGLISEFDTLAFGIILVYACIRRGHDGKTLCLYRWDISLHLEEDSIPSKSPGDVRSARLVPFIVRQRLEWPLRRCSFRHTVQRSGVPWSAIAYPLGHFLVRTVPSSGRWRLCGVSHPAQAEIGWDVIWTTISFVAWAMLTPTQTSLALAQVSIMGLMEATLFGSIGLATPYYLDPDIGEEVED
jgi:hypothetical protein